MVQFKEHDLGKQQIDPRVQKLDKLAKLLKIHVHIDGVQYGAIPKDTPYDKIIDNVASSYNDKMNTTSDNTDAQSNNDTDTSDKSEPTKKQRATTKKPRTSKKS